MLVPRPVTQVSSSQWDIPTSEDLEDSKGLNDVQRMLASCLKGIHAGLSVPSELGTCGMAIF